MRSSVSAPTVPGTLPDPATRSGMEVCTCWLWATCLLSGSREKARNSCASAFPEPSRETFWREGQLRPLRLVCAMHVCRMSSNPASHGLPPVCAGVIITGFKMKKQT